MKHKINRGKYATNANTELINKRKSKGIITQNNAVKRASAKVQARNLRKVSPQVAEALNALRNADYATVEDIEIADLVASLGAFVTVSGIITPGNLLVRQRCEIVDSESMRNDLIKRKADISYIRGELLARLVREGKIKLARANYPEDPAFYCTFAYGFHNQYGDLRRTENTVLARAVAYTESSKGFVDSQMIATGFWRVIKPIPFTAVLEKSDPGSKNLFKHSFVKVVQSPELTGDIVAVTGYVAEIFAQDVPKGSEHKYKPSAFFARMSFANGIKSIAFTSVKSRELNREGEVKSMLPAIINLVMPPEVADEYLALENVVLTEMKKIGEKQFGDLHGDTYMAYPTNGKSFEEDELFDWQLQPKPDNWIRKE